MEELASLWVPCDSGNDLSWLLAEVSAELVTS